MGTAVGGAQSRLPQPVLSRRLLRWQRGWQKLAEAGAWYRFPPPPFYAFLIFKAVIGLSNKIFQIKFYPPAAHSWVPLARNVGVGSASRAWRGASVGPELGR